ncbi:MAG: phospholipase [Idiomarinaceae bacterium]|nr:phospholipase [Idiomarinaceae bacterium]
MPRRTLLPLFCLFFVAMPSLKAQELSAMQECLLDAMNKEEASLTIAEVRQQCMEKLRQEESEDVVKIDKVEDPGALTKRLQSEKVTEFDPYVLTPHRRNYILPVWGTTDINTAPYQNFQGYEDNLEEYEAKLQLSFKVPVNKESLLVEGDKLFFGFTMQSWWQVYASNISKPFRETNYQPEVFYTTPTGWHPFGTNTGLAVGVEHLSNGRSQELSRSWNRAYVQLVAEKGPFVFSLKPWIRFQEDEKSDPMQSSGDDNPDITDYVGDYEFTIAANIDDFEYTLNLRHAIETGRGSAEFNFTFPLWGKFIGYTSLFTGYGESLIDYNHKQTRFGVGIALNNVL